jgi:hypothetical protein
MVACNFTVPADFVDNTSPLSVAPVVPVSTKCHMTVLFVTFDEDRIPLKDKNNVVNVSPQCLTKKIS